jgi:hypothetical protein
MAYGIMSLCLSFAFQPDYYSDPASYAVVGALVLCAVLLARRASPDMRRALAASALLAVACYGIIVAGRVVFFASYSSATLAMQPRYHYAGLLPLTLVLCLLLAQIGSLLRLPAWAGSALVLLWLALLTAAYVRSDFAIDHHAEAKTQTERVLGVIRARIAARPPGSEVFIENRGFAAFPGGVPRPLFPGWASVFVIYYPDEVVDGRRVRFVDRDLGVIVASARGRRSKGLLVLPN